MQSALTSIYTYWPAMLIGAGVLYWIIGMFREQSAYRVVFTVLFAGSGALFVLFPVETVWAWLVQQPETHWVLGGPWYSATLRIAGLVVTTVLALRVLVGWLMSPEESEQHA